MIGDDIESSKDWSELETDSEKIEDLIDGFGIGTVRPDAAEWLRLLVESKRRADIAYQVIMSDSENKIVNLTRLGDWLSGEDIDHSCLLDDFNA